MGDLTFIALVVRNKNELLFDNHEILSVAFLCFRMQSEEFRVWT